MTDLMDTLATLACRSIFTDLYELSALHRHRQKARLSGRACTVCKTPLDYIPRARVVCSKKCYRIYNNARVMALRNNVY